MSQQWTVDQVRFLDRLPAAPNQLAIEINGGGTDSVDDFFCQFQRAGENVRGLGHKFGEDAIEGFGVGGIGGARGEEVGGAAVAYHAREEEGAGGFHLGVHRILALMDVVGGDIVSLGRGVEEQWGKAMTMVDLQ